MQFRCLARWVAPVLLCAPLAALAAESYQEAVRLARDTRSVIDARSETGLALAKHHLGKLGQLGNPREEALLQPPLVGVQPYRDRPARRR